MYGKKKVLAVDREHIWHPDTPMKDYAERDPLVIVKGRGVKLRDADGRSYYDTISSWWCNLHGHGRPEISRGVARQLKSLEHTLFAGITHPPAAELADLLGQRLDPQLNRFFFSDNGSTAVEIALKMAFQYWQNLGVPGKTQFVFFNQAYHGDTVGSMSVGGIDLYHRLFAPLRFQSHQAEAPDCGACARRKTAMTFDARRTGCGLQCFRSMENILRREHGSIAAVIVEPLMQGAGGIRLYPPAYLRKLRDLTAELDLLLIYDEVATGFGRTGTFFAYEQARTVPDFICLSKGLTAGYLPLALTVTREFVYRAFYGDAGKAFFHGHTYTANPLACAAGIESLKLMRRKNLPASLADTMDFFHRELRRFGDWDCVGDIRYLGFVGAVDIVASRKGRLRFAPEDRIGFQIYLESLRNGLLLRPLGSTIYWFLPLCVTRAEIADIMRRSRETIRNAVAAASRKEA